MNNEIREWGEFCVLDEFSSDSGTHVKIKILKINKDKNISYQYHNFRTEVWKITKGTGILVIDGKFKNVKRGDSIVIDKCAKHSIKAIKNLTIQEIQIGDKCDEDDIVRITKNFDEIELLQNV